MTCACKPVVIAGRAKRKKPAEVEVAGSWDFKWPRNTEIRVAFQKPPKIVDAEFALIRQLIIAYAARWPIRVTVEQPNTPKSTAPRLLQGGEVRGISLRFISQTMDVPLGNTAVLGSDHNSAFLLPQDTGILEYDVLINLEDLPLARIDPFKFKGQAIPPVEEKSSPGRERVLLPLSELGSYSRRADYGAPTVFLGPFGGTVGKRSLVAHFEATLGKHVVVHEFGHILGLPHEHQNPNYQDRPYRPLAELVQEVREGFNLGQTPTEEEIDVQVVRRWPGSQQFSDWGQPKGTLYDLKSVMTYPSHQDLLEPLPASVQQVDKISIAQVFSSQSMFVDPQDVDIENLRRMYDPQSIL